MKQNEIKEVEKAIKATWGELTYTQLIFLFSSITACVGLPALLMFFLDEKLFFEIELWKLLLLCFGTSSSIVCAAFGHMWLDNLLSEKTQNTKGSFSAAISITICVYLFCITTIALGNKIDIGFKLLFISPLLLSLILIYTQIIITLIVRKIKNRKTASTLIEIESDLSAKLTKLTADIANLEVQIDAIKSKENNP